MNTKIHRGTPFLLRKSDADAAQSPEKLWQMLGAECANTLKSDFMEHYKKAESGKKYKITFSYEIEETP